MVDHKSVNNTDNIMNSIDEMFHLDLSGEIYTELPGVLKQMLPHGTIGNQGKAKPWREKHICPRLLMTSSVTSRLSLGGSLGT